VADLEAVLRGEAGETHRATLCKRLEDPEHALALATSAMSVDRSAREDFGDDPAKLVAYLKSTAKGRNRRFG
jgi:hypothetical protein